MKILYCNNNLWKSGGTERVLTTKLNWLSRQEGIVVAVAVVDQQEKPFFLLNEGVSIFTLDGTRYEDSLSELIADFDPDIIVAVSGMAVEALPKIKCRARKVLEFHYTRNYLVNFVRGLHNIRFKQLHILKMRYLQWRLARTARKYDRFVGLTARDVTLWGSPKNMTYIYNPLSFRSECKSTCLSHKIIAVGSFTPAKGMDQLVRAFSLLAKDFPDWTVDIYGSGQDEQYLLQLAAEGGVKDRITLHSPVKDIGAKLVEASIYAFPSRSDGFGLVITEAMECGLPTVAMDCPCGPREILDEKTGIVVPEGDIKAFANALASLMADENRRIAMGAEAQKAVARFYPDAIMPKWVELFKSLTTKDL